MIKGFIFDADGTLLNSMQIWREAGIRYLKNKNIEAKSDLADTLYRMSLKESSVYLKQNYGLSDDTESVTNDILGIVEDFYKKEVTLKQGAAEFLEKARSLNIPMIVASANNRTLLENTFERLGICRFFKDILTCDELNINKRDAKIYLAAAEKIHTTPVETAVFEDVLFGIDSAKSAGFTTVAVEDLSNICDRELLRETADIYISDFTSIAPTDVCSKDCTSKGGDCH